MKKELIGLSKEELCEELALIGEKPFRAKQLWQWIYFKGETNFDNMTNLSKELRTKLKNNYPAAYSLWNPGLSWEAKTHALTNASQASLPLKIPPDNKWSIRLELTTCNSPISPHNLSYGK